MTQEELFNILERVGIKGEWVKPDEYGYSRLLQFEIDGQAMQIEWYCNLCTLMIGSVHFWFDRISTDSGYPCKGEWIEFSFRGGNPIHLRVSKGE